MLLTTAYVQYSIRVYYSGRERGHIYHVLVYLLCFWLQFILLFMFLFNYRVYYDLPIKGDHCPIDHVRLLDPADRRDPQQRRSESELGTALIA